jgi:Trypsin.
MEQELNIDEIYLHEELNVGVRLNNDIALVKLKGLGIHLGPYVMPACLPHHGIQYTPGLNCTISGWGSMKAAGPGEYNRYLAEGLKKKYVVKDVQCQMRFLTAFLLNIQVFWDVTLYLWMCSFPCFEGS